ncbi:hypothetical protein [Variovorax paradoxus]|jgi:hypothetical protein|uniref:Uncharacterized protein n=2 Tax=Variovorax paradoxus TaxID=34073 RepID=A0AAW8ER87_VARPD|nr:hypothetical protein [Variovorax paradoxus]MBW8716786.1 hypothetical protein [Variovorax paradoxus]MDP9974994.1 hypothetical protein [Variovorax paradoxus]
MPMDLLKQIAASRLPVSFRTPKEIDEVRILRQAGLVIALIPAPADPLKLAGSEPAAQVLAITEKGREELARIRYPGELPQQSKRRHAGLKGWLGEKRFGHALQQVLPARSRDSRPSQGL